MKTAGYSSCIDFVWTPLPRAVLGAAVAVSAVQSPKVAIGTICNLIAVNSIASCSGSLRLATGVYWGFYVDRKET